MGRRKKESGKYSINARSNVCKKRKKNRHTGIKKPNSVREIAGAKQESTVVECREEGRKTLLRRVDMDSRKSRGERKEGGGAGLNVNVGAMLEKGNMREIRNWPNDKNGVLFVRSQSEGVLIKGLKTQKTHPIW